MGMQEEIQSIIDRFHEKMDSDEKVRKEVEPLEKSLNIDLGDSGFALKLKDAKIYYFEPGLLDQADITITTTEENLRALMDGTLRPMRAYVLKKIQIKGKIDDLMFLKKLF